MDELLIYGTLRDVPILSWLLWADVERRRSIHYLVPMQTERVYTISGACMMIRAKAFVAVGRFDERTFLYQEEPILSERLLSHGWTIIAVPSTHYEHDVSASARWCKAQCRMAFVKSEQILLRNYWRQPIGATLLLMVRAFEILLESMRAPARRLLNRRSALEGSD